jgi:NAD(P)H-dependent FMN reductase
VDILAFAATSSRQSINAQLMAFAARLLEQGLIADATVEIIDLNDYEMPLYSIDREHDLGIPPAAHAFVAKISAADAVLISFAEHNGHYTAVYKNLLDWASRIDRRVYQGRPTVMLATSPGPGGGRRALEAAVSSAPFFGNDLRASLSIPRFDENFDRIEKKLTDPALETELARALASLATQSDEHAA